MVINGILGLVSITAGCNVVGPMAILIGFIAGILVDVAVLFFDKMKVDDPVGAVDSRNQWAVWNTCRRVLL